MSYDDVFLRVTELFAGLTDAADEITADSELMDDLDISSMDVLFIVASLESEFGIKIPRQMLRKIVSVGDVVDIIYDTLS